MIRQDYAWEHDVYERFWRVAVVCIAATGVLGTCAVTSWMQRRVAAHPRGRV